MVDDGSGDDKALAWVQEELRRAVAEITDKGVIESPLAESRPAWVRPFEVVIGQLRDQGAQTEFLWVIGGSVPTDCLHSSVAATARDAARHFSLKWQLEAARYEDPAERRRLGLDPGVDWQAQAKALTGRAEYLYELVEDDSLWQ